MKQKNSLNPEEIINEYKGGVGVEALALKYHVGKLKIRTILKENGIEMMKRGGQKLNVTYVVPDWKIEKYPQKEGFHYIAVYKSDGTEFNDYMNQGGFLTSYIKKKEGVEIPTLYDRRKYYMETGNYWWEQWFDITLVENKPTKKCPYCGWETIDVENKSGVFEQHLNEVHGIDKITYLKEYPQDKDYFVLVNQTLNLQMSINKDEYVICQICGKKLSRIDWRHLKEHELTKEQYIKKYGYTTVSKNLHDTMSNIAIMTNMDMEFTKHSKSELEIVEYIEKYKFECKSDRKILLGKEIDIFIPELNFGIEYNGNIFHSEWKGGKDRYYHVNKTDLCKTKNIKLIQIFEDEFHNSKEIVFNKIAHILGVQQNLPKIYGRKCKIKQILKNDAETFLNNYHIQGYVSATVHYGAFYENTLIAVMSFKTENNGKWELTRFVSNYNYICCGVGGKLFRHFIKECNPNSVKSFADRRWTVDEENNVYIQLGFKFDGYTKPDYKYYNAKIDKYKRFHKFGFRKQILLKKYPDILNENMTETEMAKELGYDRIWDCGLIRYVWKK